MHAHLQLPRTQTICFVIFFRRNETGRAVQRTTVHVKTMNARPSINDAADLLKAYGPGGSKMPFEAVFVDVFLEW